MPLEYNPNDFNDLKTRISSIFSEIKPDLELIGKIVAETIVRTTLAGIGEGDQAFAPYSAQYQALIDAVGGKPQQTVNLRGLFYHKGQKRVKFRSEARRQQFREGRRAIVQVHFTLARRAQKQTREYRKAGGLGLTELLRHATGVRRSNGPRSQFASVRKLKGDTRAAGQRGLAIFQAKTGLTRPAKGVTDPLSEMSLDLIKVVVAGEQMKIIYTARKDGYMIVHNEGSNKMPKRKWFTLDKAAVKAALVFGFETILKARMLRAQLDQVPDTGPVGAAAEPVIREVLGNPGE